MTGSGSWVGLAVQAASNTKASSPRVRIASTHAHGGEAKAVLQTRAVLSYGRNVFFRGIPFMGGKAVAREPRIQAAQYGIALHFGDDRGCRNAEAARIPAQDRGLGQVDFLEGN